VRGKKASEMRLQEARAFKVLRTRAASAPRTLKPLGLATEEPPPLPSLGGFSVAHIALVSVKPELT
jgi:hypothetical protein